MKKNQNNRKTQKLPHFKHLGRELAMQFLFQFDMQGRPADIDLKKNFWEQVRLCCDFTEDRFFKKARKYAEKLLDGILDNLDEIDSTIKGFSEKWDIDRMAIVDRNILRVAIYEMKFVPEVPPIVSIDEAVTIAKNFSAEKSGLFINGILNGIKDSLSRPAREAVETL